jgi:hypothetical protein
MKSEATKKPYNRPELLMYGDLREITLATSGKSKNVDSGTAPNNKTS